MLRLYSDKSFVLKEIGHIPLLYPLWGNCDTEVIDKGRYDDWTGSGRKYISLVPIEECDAVVLPSEWRTGYKDSFNLASMAKRHGKKIIIFFNNDSDEYIPIENAVIFQTSLYASRRRPNEFALPAWTSDFCGRYLGGKISLRAKTDVPTVGYAGYVDYRNFYERCRCAIARLRYPASKKEAGRSLRGKAVRQLKRRPEINTNFILRSGCMTGSADAKSREEYLRCILNSDYSLVIRGGGNFSYRLYEILSCGRLPLFVNTDCVLPFDHLIDWKKYMLWVESSEVDAIAEKTVGFHSRLSCDEFIEIQNKIRRLYEEWLCPTGFFSNIWRYVK